MERMAQTHSWSQTLSKVKALYKRKLDQTDSIQEALSEASLSGEVMHEDAHTLPARDHSDRDQDLVVQASIAEPSNVQREAVVEDVKVEEAGKDDNFQTVSDLGQNLYSQLARMGFETSLSDLNSITSFFKKSNLLDNVDNNARQGNERADLAESQKWSKEVILSLNSLAKQ